MNLQAIHPDCHISCAGRGKFAQEALYKRGASKAHYGQSSHNFNAAIDLFRLLEGKYDLNDDWFHEVIEPNLKPELEWYGRDDAVFYERPHVELKGWRDLAKKGLLDLVE